MKIQDFNSAKEYADSKMTRIGPKIKFSQETIEEIEMTQRLILGETNSERYQRYIDEWTETKK